MNRLIVVSPSLCWSSIRRIEAAFAGAAGCSRREMSVREWNAERISVAEVLHHREGIFRSGGTQHA